MGGKSSSNLAGTNRQSDVLSLGIAALSEAFISRRLSPVDLAKAIIANIESDSNDINAFCILDREGTLKDAAQSEKRYQLKSPLSVLDGIPVSIKDLINVAGWPTRRGSLATADEPSPQADSPVVAILRKAGCPILGKTTTSEFGWAPISESAHSGTTRNPRVLSRSAGGSSSGAAAQVASGWGPMAIGSDAGGSVRVPASYCGLVGFKPTHGAIPQAPLSALGDFSHLGPLTRTVDDCALAMQVLSSPDSRDQTSLFPRADGNGREKSQSLRIGWATQFGTMTIADPHIVEAVEKLISQLEKRDYRLEKLDFSWLEASDALWDVWTPRVYESFVAWPDQKRTLLDPRVKRVYEIGERLDLASVTNGRIRLRDISTRLTDVFTRFDFLITPTTPTGALPFGHLAPETHPWFAQIQDSGNNFAASPYCYPFNVTQQPAISIPLGVAPDGCPFGAQIVGRKYQDGGVLEVARVIEQLLADASGSLEGA